MASTIGCRGCDQLTEIRRERDELRSEVNMLRVQRNLLRLKLAQLRPLLGWCPIDGDGINKIIDVRHEVDAALSQIPPGDP